MHSGDDMKEKTWRSGLGWLAAGVAASYLLDGVSGRRRRSRLAQRLLSLERHAESELGKGVRDLAHRAHGLAAEVGAAFSGEHPSDPVLAGRVRARIGRVFAQPHAVSTQVQDGRVVLSGTVAPGERDRLVRTMASVRGVRGVEDRLEERDTGGVARPRPRLAIRWTPGVRLMVGALGGVVASWGSRRKMRSVEALGLLAAARAASGRPRMSTPIELHKTVHVRAPVEAVFHYFADYQNFPRFMTHVREVQMLDGDRSHWAVEGPAGVLVEWDARITELDPNRLIAWRTEPGSAVYHQGSVRFIPEGGGTRMDIQLSYHPPAGSLGHAVAALFARDPKHEMDDDLLRFKSLLEEGKARGRGEAVRREDLLH
jgi:uncharacterized membrane protein